MVPMMVGMLTTSIISGQVISRTGRYKMFPVAGTIAMSVALFLLSRMSLETSRMAESLYLALLGLGMGMVMQVLVLAVQNSVDYNDLGVATSGATLFRFIGGSVGTAILGAIFTSRLTEQLQRALPGSAAQAGRGINMQALAALSPAARHAYAGAFTAAISAVFTLAFGVCLFAVVIALLIPEKPLRATVAARAGSVSEEIGEAFAMPATAEAIEEMLQGLRALEDRDLQREYLREATSRAGVDLSPVATWLMLRIERDGTVLPEALSVEHKVPLDRIVSGLRELRQRGLVAESVNGAGARLVLTPGGCQLLERLLEANAAEAAVDL
jgi:MFS family permease